MIADKIQKIESEISVLNDKIWELKEEIYNKQRDIYNLYSEINSVEELADVLSSQVPRYYSVYYSINGHNVTVWINDDYEYIDVVGLSKKDEDLFKSIY